MKTSPIKWTTAKFAAKCPQCKRPIAIGDKIGQPQSRNRSGGRTFIGAWYCPMDSEILALEGDAAPFLSVADVEGHKSAKAAATEEIRKRYQQDGK